VYVADGGGGAPAPGPLFTGTQTLNIEPSAIPDALKAFTDAHDQVLAKISELHALPINDWAGDPVSGETAVRFQQRSNRGGADSALTCLEGYEQQLSAAIKSLKGAHADYVRVEGDNAALWGKYHRD
jgi:hypothetical protein